MTKHIGIALIEGRYWDGYNISYRGIFDLLSERFCGNGHGFHYETANSKVSLQEILPRLQKNKSIKYICIAGHGERNKICMINKDFVECGDIANILSTSNRHDSVRGLHISACWVIDGAVAGGILNKGDGLQWVSGYKASIGWLEASALDLLFFNLLVENEHEETSKTIRKSAKEISKYCPGLIKTLGFGIYMRSKGAVVNLCEAE